MMGNLRRGKNSVEAENIVMLDEESDCFGNVDIPKPESLAKKSRGSKRLKNNKNFSPKSYIYIDDDDDDDDAKHSPVKFSKCKRTYPGKDSNNCHGARKQSNKDPSTDHNASECELMVDSKGMLQKLWERAALKKKTNVQSESDSKKGHCGFGHNNEKSKETPAASNQVENEEKHQAEEAKQLQRLLKRKEAEKLRLLDIERRQKQRVKEIRETQQQEKENMNLKEIYRTKVQNDLRNLEMTCHDMSSLLRGLGIFVDDSSTQIRAAYKRALLSFHPDRATGSDMHQQVEAEEKFKLISRMRDKFL
ncbi:unnamed protein product [Lactuca virosa]|uniref:J domain-containing protein n=1 Tax=Lactuca virosa TaxID=75947 RepID=A0AAU9M757_9ASTR|nr:unnamed protein product [Lactuca virosa]